MLVHGRLVFVSSMLGVLTFDEILGGSLAHPSAPNWQSIIVLLLRKACILRALRVQKVFSGLVGFDSLSNFSNALALPLVVYQLDLATL